MQKESQTYKIAPAERLASVSEYYFSKKLKEVAQMNAEGKDVISLGIGSPDMPPSKVTIETLCNNAHDPNGHGYQPYVGIPELRKGFAAWYQRWYGVELNPNTEIQPLIGSKEGILHVTLAFVNPGEQVLVPNPGYPTPLRAKYIHQVLPMLSECASKNSFYICIVIPTRKDSSPGTRSRSPPWPSMIFRTEESPIP